LLTAKIHKGVGAALTHATQGASKRSLTQPWVASMLRMINSLGEGPFNMAENLQAVDFVRLANSITAQDVLHGWLVDTVEVRAGGLSGRHEYLNVDCYMPHQNYVLRPKYKTLVGLAAKVGVRDEKWGIGGIVFTACWAHFILCGDVMKTHEFSAMMAEIDADLKQELKIKADEEQSEWDAYMELPNNTRLNLMDHEFLARLKLGLSRTRTHTHTHACPHTQAHTNQHTPITEAEVDEHVFVVMRAFAAIGFLQQKTDRGARQTFRRVPTARETLSKMVDVYHKEHPNTQISRLGVGIKLYRSVKARQLDEDERVGKRRQQEQEQLVADMKATAVRRKRDAAEAAEAKKRREAAKADAQAEALDEMDQKWKSVQAVIRQGEEDDELEEQKFPGWKAPGWRHAPWPVEMQADTDRDKMLKAADRANIKLVYDDIRHSDVDSLGTRLAITSARILDLLPNNSNFTLCLLGLTSQSPTVMQSLCPIGWTWGAPYTIQLDSDSHTLERDLYRQFKIHNFCQDAFTAGDTTYGLDVGVIFRLYRGTMTDSRARARVAVPRWNAGREAFKSHRAGDVPDISHTAVTKEPYRYSLDISAALPHAEEFPLEFALTNFLYWHTREQDVVMVLQDAEDVFGCAAMYCRRRVLAVSLQNSVDDNHRKKAYTTMALLLVHDADAFFAHYPADAKFATFTVKNNNARRAYIARRAARSCDKRTSCVVFPSCVHYRAMF
jgi:hypothetical protein